MNEAQIKEAIKQVEVDCELKLPNYEYVSLRSSLYSLGYGSEDAQAVIDYCASHGFNYCLDYTVKHSDGSYPPDFACSWGPDQLASRLRCVR